MITYLNAVRADAVTIADIFRECFVGTFGHLYRPDDLAAFLAAMTADRFLPEIGNERYAFRIAESEGKPVGYVKLGPPELPVETPPDCIELCHLYVLQSWHGTGVASELMEWALASAAQRGAKHIQLSVYIENHRARRFYEQYGFAMVGRYDFMVGSHADEDIVLRHIVMDAAP